MAIKSYYTKKLGASVASSARSSVSGNYHVISRENSQWSVVPSGSLRAVRIFPTKQEAITYAKTSAAKKTGEVIVHTKTGQLQRTISPVKKSA